jgi:hypothetical protein
MCFIALYATVYLPLHYGAGVDYGQSPRLGDIVALVSGAVAIAIGVLILTRRTRNLVSSGVWLVAAGVPTSLAVVVWAFPETFHVSVYPLPFYYAYVYFTDIGGVDTGQGYVGLPLLAACAIVTAAGLATLSPSSRALRPLGS